LNIFQKILLHENTHHIWIKSNQKYDYIFCGMWASTSLLLIELSRNWLLKNKKILLIDQELKNKNDKTFCFWSFKDDPISKHLQDLISTSWDTIELANSQYLSLSPLWYNHIHSINLYKQAQTLIKKYNCDTITMSISSIYEDTLWAYIMLHNTKIRAHIIFDSRSPEYEKSKNWESHIYQSFVGWMIETENTVINPSAFRFMDFDIPQLWYTQFVYVLPFSDSRALVEVTRFGSEAIDTSQAEEILETYIQKSYGNFKKIEVEIWCIPMSHRKIKIEQIWGVIHLGARNYNIKASTGYAFKNMYSQAYAITQSLKNNEDIQSYNTNHSVLLKSRFAFYDALLLDILENKPHYWKAIFTKFLQEIDIQKTLKFLDEKTNLKEEISIFIKLPWKPFLGALFKKITRTWWFLPLMLTLLTLLFIFLGKYTSVQSEVGFILFAVGMLTIGIPHGAVDHLLETGLWNRRKAPMFIISYILLSGIIGILWFLLPQVALIVFVVYSMWHFGQADGKKWNFSAITSFAWWVSVLVYILGTHFDETNIILNSLGSSQLPFSIPILGLFSWIILAFYKKSFSFSFTLIWLTLSSQIPLLFAFGLYFIGQHSFTAWTHIKWHLKISNSHIWLHSLPFHAGAWMILLIFYFFWPIESTVSPYWKWGIFFIFIACISFPHVITMDLLYRRKKTTIE